MKVENQNHNQIEAPKHTTKKNQEKKKKEKKGAEKPPFAWFIPALIDRYELQRSRKDRTPKDHKHTATWILIP